MPSTTPRQAVIRKKNDEQRRADELAASVTRSSPAELLRLLRILHLVPFYVMLLGKDHRIRFYNRAFEQYFGNPGDMPCYKILRGLDEPCRFCQPLDVPDSGSSCVMEWVAPASKHAFRVYSYPFHDENGETLVMKVGFNITSNVRVQQALDLSEQSYRTITDNLSIGIAALGPDLAVKTSNRRMKEWFGPGIEQAGPVCDLLRCVNRETKPKGGFCQDCTFRQAVAEGKAQEREFSVTLNGEERMVRLVACPVTPHRGKARALIMMLEDITDRLRMSRQLQRARKLEAMGTLAGGIAHEINQPLSALHLYAGGLQMLLEKQGEVSADVTQERLSLIMNEAEKIRSIITHMRGLVMKEGRPVIEAVDVAETLRGVVRLMRSQFSDRGVNVRVELPAGLPKIAAGKVQLEQVCVNLISNAMHALDAVPAEGPARRLIRIRAGKEKDDSAVWLEVADTGPGLPEAGERIFDPFFTTKDPHQGMGLGLSIVNGLVRQWGGEIRARARHPELGGAAFYVFLPIMNEDASSEQKATAPEPAPEEADDE